MALISRHASSCALRAEPPLPEFEAYSQWILRRRYCRRYCRRSQGDLLLSATRIRDLPFEAANESYRFVSYSNTIVILYTITRDDLELFRSPLFQVAL